MKKRNLKVFAGVVALSGVFALASCSLGSTTDIGGNTYSNTNTGSASSNTSGSSTGTTVEADNTVVTEIEEDINEGDFVISTEDGAYTQQGSTYTITKGGTYSLSGTLKGQVYVCVTEPNDSSVYDVVIELNGVTITNDSDSAIYIAESTDENISYDVEISAQKDTTNIIKDTRALQTNDSDTTGSGAIYSEVDLKLKGKGLLYVNASYNNGIHTKDDLEIKNLTLSVTAPNNALKGNDSVTIESGTLTVISTGGDGIKTTNTDISSKGNQKGTIAISGGEVTIYSACDAIDAAYNAEISSEADIVIYTSDYSDYTGDIVSETSSSLSSYTTTNAPGGSTGPSGSGSTGPGGRGFTGSGNSNKSSYSSKGIKADNQILISGGEIYIKSNDDGIHANNDAVMESTSSYGEGDVFITGGSITIYASDDGIHAEDTIKISDSAYVNVTYAYEGIEANQIYFNGGSTYVYATDDAVNAATAGVSTTPCVYITDGYVDLDCASGDTDTFDSNGNIKMTGGYVVLKNRSTTSTSQTGGTIDCDGSISMTGGLLISFGTWSSEVNLSATKSSTSTVKAGTYTVENSSKDTILSTTLATSYAGYRVISKLSGSYTLYCGSTTVTTF